MVAVRKNPSTSSPFGDLAGQRLRDGFLDVKEIVDNAMDVDIVLAC